MIAEVITAWESVTVTGREVFAPTINNNYTLLMCVDSTNQPAENLRPKPNLYIVQIECDEATLDLIEADPNYYVNWSEA